MNLQYIQDKICPKCHAEISAEAYETSHVFGEVRQHTNGQRWENRSFACGFMLSWIPNFGCVKETGVCRMSVEFAETKKKIDEAKVAILKFIETQNVPDEIKSRWNSGIW